MKALSRAVAITKTVRILVAAGACLTTMVTTASAAMPLQTGLDSGATSWVLTASALVLFMTLPGLTLFYGGLVPRDLAAVLMRRCFVISCVVSLVWLAFGYSLVFAPGSQLLGSLDAAFLRGAIGRLMPSGVPEGSFALFQMTFAIITPALIIGAVTERSRFSFVILFSAIWTAFVYVPVAHWVWGGGWLARMGTLDFAGGIVVHTTAGVSALVAAWLVGPRYGFPQRVAPAPNPEMTTVGAAMLWVGWFGFNGGSALAADASAASAILATQFAAAAAGLAWITVERFRLGKPSPVGIASGCIAGLATITPASGYVGPIGAAAIGVMGGVVCCIAAGVVKDRLRIDDSLDVFGVHGLGGILGSLLLAAFALPALGGSGYGHPMSAAGQLGAQAIGVGAAAVWSAIGTYLIVKFLDATVGARVSLEEERNRVELCRGAIADAAE
jgi:Amt family ammonium transporter